MESNQSNVYVRVIYTLYIKSDTKWEHYGVFKKQD